MATTAIAETNQVETLEGTLKKVVIPSIEFREANPVDVIDFLIDSVASYQYPERAPTSIVLNLSNDSRRIDVQDPRKVLLKDSPNLTLEMQRITFLDAIKQITAKAGLTYEITNNELLIKTKDGTILNKKK